MKVTMHAMSVELFANTLGNLSGILEKAGQVAESVGEDLDRHRVHRDFHVLPFQVLLRWGGGSAV